MTRIALATSIKTRTGAPEGKDARLKNSYIEVRGEQSVVRKRPSAQGGVSVGTGTAQGGCGLVIFYGDTAYPITSATGTSWESGASYSIGYHVSVDFVDYWAVNDNTNSQPPSADWSEDYVPGLSKTYATWNPLDKDSSITLSDGNLTASSSAYGMVRGTVGKASGKWYWEATYSSGGAYGPTRFIGVALSTAALGNGVGQDVNGYAMISFDDTGLAYAEKYNNNSSSNYGPGGADGFANGDVIGIALNMDTGAIAFYVNGVSYGDAYTGLSGTIYPACSFAHTSYSFTMNFGQSPFSYSVPVGYNSGLYTL